MDMRLKTSPRLLVDDTTNVEGVEKERRLGEKRLFWLILVSVLVLTPILILLATVIGFSTLLGLTLVGSILILVARRPIVGFYLVAGCVVLFEALSLDTPIITDNLPIYAWPPKFNGLPERPIGFFMLYIFLVIIVRHLLARERPVFKGGPMLGPLLGLLLCVVWGIVHGLASGGVFKIIVLEVRPFWYIFMTYLLAYNLLTDKKQVRTFFWILILCSTIKSFQGVYVLFGPLHGNMTAQHDILGHEVSFFFVSVLLLLLLFVLQYRDRAQMWVIILSLPTLLLALVANQRRTDYIALLLGAGLVWILTMVIKPHIRGRLLTLLSALAVAGAIYVFAFAHAGGAFAAPARAVYSVFSPEGADASSNMYRWIENFDLRYTVQLNPMGLGFGKPFLQPVPLAILATSDPTADGNPYQFIPHNTIYWVWMRLGYIGYFALWLVFGTMIVRGCLIVRNLRDRYIQLIGLFILGTTLMEVIVAFADYQLYFFRNVIFFGLTMGILMKLPDLEEREERKKLENVDPERLPARNGVGS
ncbi:hypothetical protein [Ktedonospora formicarum]|uniref:Uncharacterized protein n=1 Tax=Ktedonospora formicarum TaxID=2778364 RepID=A0A8J3HYE3_9CHLR|nr:hypothetical protein [Ktedonospora formicarum]GHO43283.1 hypothetical protein KSX_14460 [Ktedonospora formicarum]